MDGEEDRRTKLLAHNLVCWQKRYALGLFYLHILAEINV